MVQALLDALPDALRAAAIISNGLLAGTFFVFTCAVIPGMRQVDHHTFVSTFRAINRAILNGVFLLVFVTAPLSAIACAVTGSGTSTGISPVVAGTAAACSLLTFLNTAAKNVPLNDQLARARIGTPAGTARAREAFERPWARWNLVRTLSSILALALLVVPGWLG
jgi:uncharacterized membrane protein